MKTQLKKITNNIPETAKIIETLGGYEFHLGSTKGIGRTVLAAIVNFDDQASSIKENKPYFDKKKPKK